MNCVVCGKEVEGYIASRMRPGSQTECETCWKARKAREAEEERAAEIKLQADRILGDLEAWSLEELKAAGVAPRELKADRDHVPAAIKRAIPKPVLEAVLDGRIPPGGFGLGASVGGGKTCALVSILKIGSSAYGRREAPARGLVSYRETLEFVSWPEEVNALRFRATDPSTPVRIERLSTVPLLVLDDLGRERIRGSYADDWAACQLDAIINHRYRNELPILWTTNVPRATADGGDLLGLYGAALLSRLEADNPLTWVPDLPDLRRKR